MYLCPGSRLYGILLITKVERFFVTALQIKDPAFRRDPSYSTQWLVNKLLLTATHAITAIQTLITCSAPHRNMSASITSRGIALHALRGYVHRIH